MTYDIKYYQTYFTSGRSFGLNTTTITVGSVTYAIKLRKLFAREGIESELIKVTVKREGGCTHAVRINRSDLFRAVVIMREKGIEYSVFEES